MQKYTREFLISEFWRWVNEHKGKTPTRNDFQIKYGYPSSFQYEKMFNTRKWNIILKEFGIKPNNEFWKDEEIDFLKNNWENMSDIILAEKLNKTEYGLRYKRNELNLFRQSQQQKWQEWEIEYLKENFYDTPQEEIQNKLNHRKWETIRAYATKKLKLKRHNRLHKYVLPNNKRQCKKCQNIFDENADNFYKDRTGFHTLCINCFKEEDEIKNRENGIITKKLRLELFNNGYSYCGSCKEWKTNSEFSKTKHDKFGIRRWCIDCTKKNFREYYIKRTYGEDFTEEDYYTLNKDLYDILGNKCDSIPEKNYIRFIYKK